ncbi:nuclear transport factor 2 family protein [Paenibacillus campi]|uniref:nuclear transport factor 2 family protein n=1 Tax=Paenibacillus campi TaxID=3106031 RepID=UPI002AFF3F38|nr:nuclear transport factor 2 family protein [Paenibacillus sp. SGZ-1009]
MNTQLSKSAALELLNGMYRDVVMGLDDTCIDRYFMPDYVQMTDGVRSDLAQFKHHIRMLRQQVQSVQISPFTHMLYDEPLQTATLRYTVDVEKKNGKRGQVELIAIFELQQGKVRRCYELSCALDYEVEFEGIASLS